jgi:hypothetical protein
MGVAAEPVTAREVFYSYSHRDAELRDELERHLSILKRSGFIRIWHDRQIDAGTEWAGQIHEHLNRANVILLLVSADFLASDYCYDVEMKRAMERHEAGEAVVIPIILRPVDWSGAPFAKVQCLPTDARPVTSWPNRDEGFRNVAEGIRRAIVRVVSQTGTQVQERALDAAIPSTVPLGLSSEMITQIRRINSQGLKAVLRVEQSHDSTERDVQSRPFRMEFARNSLGELVPQVLTVRLESNDFEVLQPSKQIRVPPDGDSETCLFLVTPRHAGQLALIVEVLHEGISVASRMLRTKGEEAPQFVGSGTYRIASLPLTTYAYSTGTPGEFTPLFRMGATPAPATGGFPQPAAKTGPQPVPPPPAVQQPDGFTDTFPGSPQSPMAESAPPLAASQPPSAPPGEFTRLFNSPLPEGSLGRPAGESEWPQPGPKPKEAGAFTRMFQSPDLAVPKKEEAQQGGEFTRFFKAQGPEGPQFPAAPLPPASPNALPPRASAPPPQPSRSSKEGEFSRMFGRSGPETAPPAVPPAVPQPAPSPAPPPPAPRAARPPAGESATGAFARSASPPPAAPAGPSEYTMLISRSSSPAAGTPAGMPQAPSGGQGGDSPAVQVNVQGPQMPGVYMPQPQVPAVPQPQLPSVPGVYAQQPHMPQSAAPQVSVPGPTRSTNRLLLTIVSLAILLAGLLVAVFVKH